MISETICPVILSGGAGTRLWPLSRSEMPKQMLRLVGAESLIQAAALRAPASLGFAPPIVVAGMGHKRLVESQLAEVGVVPGAVILEPAGRNTAPAIALAAAALDPDMLMLVMPSDQVIRSGEAFLAAVAAAAPIAADGWLTTFGIAPERAETGYGYIEAGAGIGPGVRRVVRFVEKPDAATAARYVAVGSFYWNAGIFLMRAGSYLDALAEHAPAIAEAVAAASLKAVRSGVTIVPDRATFLASPSDSIDYAVMEKAERVAVVPADIGWSDIGAFSALWEQLPRDADGNAAIGDTVIHGARNTLVRSDGPLVAAVGVSDVSIIATGDAVLVVAHDRAQDVKVVADALKRAGRAELTTPASEVLAWGARRVVARGDAARAELIEVAPGATGTIGDAGGGHVTLVGGEAALADAPVAVGEPVAFTARATVTNLSATRPASLLATINLPHHDTD